MHGVGFFGEGGIERIDDRLVGEQRGNEHQRRGGLTAHGLRGSVHGQIHQGDAALGVFAQIRGGAGQP